MIKALYRNQYSIKRVLSRGGFSIIYLAEDNNSQTEIALKVGRVDQEDPGYAKSIREEARLLNELNHPEGHPNIVQIKPISRASGKPDVYLARAVELPGNPYFFVMDYLPGGTLDTYLQQVKRLPVGESAAVALELARALHYLHSKGYAHNDLKPENVVFRLPIRAGAPFNATLIDFGIATRVNLQVHAGSANVMAPEQLKQARLEVPPEIAAFIDLKKVDVWGLGILLYRMLGGRLPFEDRNEGRLTSRIIESNPTSLLKLSQNLPAEIDWLILEGCLAKRPEDRISMVELGHKLRKFGHGITASKAARTKRMYWPFSGRGAD